MVVPRTIDVTVILVVAANKAATAGLLAVRPPRRILYPVLTVRAALDGGHRCGPACICALVGG